MKWSSIVELITRAHPHAIVESEHSVRFVFLVGEGRQTRVGIRMCASQIYGEDIVVIAADLGPASHVEPTTALEFNARLVHGTLIVDAGVLHLRTLLGLGELLPARFEQTVRLLAIEASEIKQRINAGHLVPSRALSALGHFAD